MITSTIIETPSWLHPSRPKLPTGALFVIPDDLLADIYTIWLRLEDVCRLDSAVCSKLWRPPLLRLISTPWIQFCREEINVLDGGVVCLASRDMHTTHKPLTVPALKWVIARNIHLASLNVQHNIRRSLVWKYEIHNAIASLLSQGCLDKLEMINLYLCKEIKDAHLVAILARCAKSMKSLDIRYSGILKTSANHIKECKGLLEFATNGKESASGLIEIVKSCKKLRKFTISDHVSVLTNDVVTNFTENCHFLECFNISYSVGVFTTDSSIRKILNSNSLLQYVKLEFTEITDATIMSMCLHCPKIKIVYVGHCINLTDVAIIAMAKTLTGLTHIGLQSIEAITSNAVEILVCSCRELGFINLSGCPNINYDTLLKIVENCSRLEELYVEDCPAVTNTTIADITSICSMLKVIKF